MLRTAATASDKLIALFWRRPWIGWVGWGIFLAITLVRTHPRRFGYACHVGLWLGIPTLGCAKSVLVGQYREPGQKRGCVAPLRDRDEVIGMAVRTRDATQPVYASVGNFIDLPSAVRVILESARGYRIPEPMRQAHVHVNLLRRQGLGC